MGRRFDRARIARLQRMATIPARLGFPRRRHARALLRGDRAAKTTHGKTEGEDMANRMKILIGYDGSECADAALDDLRMAGLPSDAQIKVLSVVENWLPPPSALEIIEHIDRDHEYLALAPRGVIRLVSMEP